MIRISYFKENYLEIVLALLYLNAALPHSEEFYAYFRFIMYLLTIALLFKRWHNLDSKYIVLIFILLLIDNPIYIIDLRSFVWVIYDALVILFYLVLPRTYQKN